MKFGCFVRLVIADCAGLSFRSVRYLTVVVSLGWFFQLDAETVGYRQLIKNRLVQQGKLSLGVGWCDNILSSKYSPVARSYLLTEIEEMCWMPLGNSWEVFALLEGNGTRHESLSNLVEGEYRLNGHLEVRRIVGDRLQLRTKVMLLRERVPVDYSEDDSSRFLAILSSSAVAAGETCLVQIVPTLAAEAAVYLKDVNYSEIPGDYREIRPYFKIEYKNWDHLKSNFLCHLRRKNYESTGRK